MSTFLTLLKICSVFDTSIILSSYLCYAIVQNKFDDECVCSALLKRWLHQGPLFLWKSFWSWLQALFIPSRTGTYTTGNRTNITPHTMNMMYNYDRSALQQAHFNRDFKRKNLCRLWDSNPRPSFAFIEIKPLFLKQAPVFVLLATTRVEPNFVPYTTLHF